MKQKIYKLFSNARQTLLLTAICGAWGHSSAQTTYTFNYTGAQQTIALQAGSYTIEAWGADGGINLGNGSSTFTQSGGIGGYSIGTLTLTSPTTVYVNPGGKGANSTSVLNTTVAGGYNGGGYGGANATSGKSSGAGGGGASHVALASGVLSSLSSNTSAVLIVAGGGGGAGESNYASTSTQYNSMGGNGGGTSGLQNVTSGYQGRQGQGGTQTAGGGGGDNGLAVAGVPLQGIFGAGGYNPTAGVNTSAGGSGAGGGGGGWYGGGAGWAATGTSFQTGSGGGGSGYIGGMNSGTTVVSGSAGFVTNPDVAKDGHIRITELCNFSIIASTSNTLNPVICSGQSLTLTTNALSNFSWSNGATTNSIVVAPTSNTVYALTATALNNCSTTRSVSVIVSSGAPVLTVNTSTTQTCLGQTVALTASGAVTYTWSNSVNNGAAFVPSVTATYTVSGQNGCGITTAMTTVSVSPMPVSVVSTHSAICSNLSATINLVSAATGYTLLPGPLVSNTGVFIVSPQSNTTYSIAASDGICAGTASISINALPVPVLTTAVSAGTVCQGFPSILTVSGAQTYSWTTLNLSGNSVTVNPTAASAYPVTGVNSFGCIGSDNPIVLTIAGPTLNITASKAVICKGTNATLTAVGNAGSYQWTNGPGTAVNVVSPLVNTTYTVVGSSSTNSCTTTKTVDIGVFSIPLSASGTSAVCAGQEASITAAGAQSYSWTGLGNFGTISFTPTASNAYTLTGTTVTLGLNCTESLQFSVTVKAVPSLTVVATPTVICAKSQVSTLTASGAGTYSWSNQAATPSTTISSNAIGLFTYSVVGVNADNCSQMGTVLLRVATCNGIDELNENAASYIVYPNPTQSAFTIKAQESKELDLINELGQYIKHISLTESNQFEVNVSGLDAGIYMLISNENGKVSSTRIIVGR